MADSLVDLQRHGGVAVITLRDAARRNALSLALVAELEALLDEVEADESVGALVVTGEPPAFCAGADLSELATVDEHGLRSIYAGFLRIAQCPLPTVAAVNGAAVGAGMNLALAADVRIVCPSAKLDARFLQIDIHPGGGHTWMLQRLAGPQTSAAAVLFGQRVIGERAVELGLAWQCVGDDELLDTAITFAERASQVPRALAMRSKETMRITSALAAHDAALEVELDAQLWSISQK